MNRTKTIAALLCAAAIGAAALPGCTAVPQENAADVSRAAEQSEAGSLTAPDQAAAPITRADLLAAMTGEEKCWSGTTTEQYLEDFDHLYTMLEENWPYFGVVRRTLGLEMEDVYRATREKVAACNNDADFRYIILEMFDDDLESTGHLRAWNDYLYYHGLESVQPPIYSDDFAAAYQAVIDNETSRAFYRGYTAFFEALDARVDAHNAAIAEENEGVSEDSAAADGPNVETRIIEEGRIAYAAIHSFSPYTDEEADQLLAFYHAVRDFDHLIIDITGNGGGSMGYYNDLIAAPLIGEPMEVPYYMLMKGSDHNRALYINTDQWRSTAEFPALPHRNEEDLAEMDVFVEDAYTVDPSAEQAFGGRIWLLVDEVNYSSSEYAAMMSKQSGFATLVGRHTAGEGIGGNPFVFTLPNTGLVISYSAMNGHTADGRSSQEFGTEPEYLSPQGEEPLDTCLRLIAEKP